MDMDLHYLERFFVTNILLSFVLCVLSDDHHAVSEQHIKIFHKDHTQEHSKEHHGHHGELSHIGSNEPEHHEEYAWSYPSFEFSYKVHDPHSHDMKGQHETRKGDEVTGEYWLIEPDGRKRTVTYHADKHSGFHAIVHYSDDHHHINHEDKKEEEESKDEIKEEKKEAEVKEEEQVEEKKESAPVEEGHEEEVHSGKENRDHEEVGKWIHDHHWGYHGNGRHHDYKHNEAHHHEHHYMDGWHKPDEKHKDIESITIFKNLDKHGHHENQDRPTWHEHDNNHNKDEKVEGESRIRSERREYRSRYARPSHKSETIVRENYIHPSFYRHHERENTNQ